MKKIGIVLLSATMLMGCDAYNNSNKTQRAAVVGAAGGAESRLGCAEVL